MQKLTLLRFILCWKVFIFLPFGSVLFCKVHTTFLPLSNIYIKNFSQIGTSQYFQLVEEQKCFAWEYA